MSNILELGLPENVSEINVSINYPLSPQCASPKNFTQQKIILLSLASIVACSGVLGNFILLFLFSRKPIREPILIYLACCDCFVCFSYIIMFGNEALGIYFHIELAYNALFEYLLTVFILTKMDQFCIPLMLIASSSQKWAFLSNRKFGIWRHLHKRRGQLVVVIILVSLAVVGTLPLAWGFRVHHFKDCPNYFLSKEIWPTQFYDTSFFKTYLVVVTSFQVFGCFFILILLNTAVVFQLRKKRKQREDLLSQLVLLSAENARLDSVVSSVSANLQQDHRRLSSQEKEAVLTLAITVTSYLICNSLHVALTCIENWAGSLIYNHEVGWTDLYLISTDLINFLFMLTSAIRLFIHLRFNHHIRQRLHSFCPSLMRIGRSRENSNIQEFGEHCPLRRKHGFSISRETKL